MGGLCGVIWTRGHGDIRLKANPSHYHYSSGMPQEVVLLPPLDPKNPHSTLDEFASGRVDFLTTVDMAQPEQVIAYSRTHSDAALHTTLNIRTFVLQFTSRGVRELSPRRRHEIGKAVKSTLGSHLVHQAGYEDTDQFFAVFGEGGLDDSQKQTLSALVRETQRPAGGVRFFLFFLPPPL